VAAARVSGTSVCAELESEPWVAATRTTDEPDAPCAETQAEHAIVTSSSARNPTTDLMAEG
jgi:hypothetical protein